MNRTLIKVFSVFLIAAFFLIPNYSLASPKDNYAFYGYLYTGEGTYIIFEIVMFNKKPLNHIRVLTDEQIIKNNPGLDEELRENIPESNLSSFDAKRIRKTFNQVNGIKMKLKEYVINKNKIRFITEKKRLPEGGNLQFRFEGIRKKNRIIGNIFLDGDVYNKVYMEFRSVNE